MLDAKGIKLSFQQPGHNIFVSLLIQALRRLLLFGVRRCSSPHPDARWRARSDGLRQIEEARLLTENKNRVTFEDVAGVDEAKEDLTEIVGFLKDRTDSSNSGRKIWKAR